MLHRRFPPGSRALLHQPPAAKRAEGKEPCRAQALPFRERGARYPHALPPVGLRVLLRAPGARGAAEFLPPGRLLHAVPLPLPPGLLPRLPAGPVPGEPFRENQPLLHRLQEAARLRQQAHTLPQGLRGDSRPGERLHRLALRAQAAPGHQPSTGSWRACSSHRQTWPTTTTRCWATCCRACRESAAGTEATSPPCWRNCWRRGCTWSPK